MTQPGDHPHRRYNPLTGEWVLVSPHRTERPWLGQQEDVAMVGNPAHAPDCYLCPGGSRVKGANNPDYKGTYVFTNDFPALLPEKSGSQGELHNELFKWSPTSGTSRVMCYSPRHDLTLPQLSLSQIEEVVSCWMKHSQELGEQYKWVQIFENKGQLMGASNPHPHGQIWAGDFVPTEVEKESQHQQSYFQQHKASLLGDYAKNEAASGERTVCQNDDWIAVVPFWATWPFETLLLPLKPITRMPDLKDLQKHHLADILKRLLTKYDHLFNVSFPYSMGWHGAPNIDEDGSHWLLHAHIYPPLLRSASIKKFLVGYEMLAEAQRDLTPEAAAHRLQKLPEQYLS